MFSATYSPDDNKLRLYATARLSPELYARVKSAGFAWAPRQELFVAPMWTPEREDLLLELAGSVDDEDTSLLERAEERAERFDGYTESRTRDAENAAESVRRIADGIPFGQPILVGHHSERHARRDAEKIENGMRRAVKMWETAKYWEDRAQGAIRHAKYKERPDVRARRIKKIESERRKMAGNLETAEKLLGIWRDPLAIFKTAPSLHDAALFLLNGVDRHAPWGLWSDLKDGKVAAEEIQSRRIAALERYTAPDSIARRWLAHYDNRLAYERAMLADAGGTVADKTGPEVGGGCRCWASPRGGWSYIVKVNKVSVTVLDNWGNGGDHFTRTIPFDKLAAVMSRAEVEQARADGRLVDCVADSKGKVEGFVLRDSAPEPSKADSPSECRTWKEPTLAADEVNAMRATLRAGVSVAVVPDLFPTPAELAERMADLAGIEPGMSVLEPSAGTGALLQAIAGKGARYVQALEINPSLAQRLGTAFPYTPVACVDFLECNGGLGTFDRIVMNPPFTNGADIKHILHARSHLKPSGRLVALCANGPRQRETLQPIADTWEDLPDGTFAAAGTGVRVALLTIEG